MANLKPCPFCGGAVTMTDHLCLNPLAMLTFGWYRIERLEADRADDGYADEINTDPHHGGKIFESQAKATRSNSGQADTQGVVRRSTS